MQDAQFVSTVSSLIAFFQQHNAHSGYAAAQAVASQLAAIIGKGNAAKIALGNELGAVASVLGDISQMFSGSSGPGSLVKDLQYFNSIDSTAQALLKLTSLPEKAVALKALSTLGYAVGDVVTIIQGFQEGGVLGGLEAGYSADALVKILATMKWAKFFGPSALAIGIAIGLAAAFFGGHHDDPATMSDKYDTENYGQGVANLQGSAGANGQSFSENPGLTALFAGRTGIQMVEETLNMYGSASNAPAWLKPMFDRMKGMFGESATGSGLLSVGDGGSGKHANNQQIVGVSGLDSQVYQYTQLDGALAEFEAAYAKARAAGQAPVMTWVGSGPVPSEDYASPSYQRQEYLA